MQPLQGPLHYKLRKLYKNTHAAAHAPSDHPYRRPSITPPPIVPTVRRWGMACGIGKRGVGGAITLQVSSPAK